MLWAGAGDDSGTGRGTSPSTTDPSTIMLGRGRLRNARGGSVSVAEGVMRLWHLVFAVAVVAVVMTLVRDDAGRVAVIVFGIGVGECAFATAALMALFQTVGAFGKARGPIAHAAAIAATTLVLATASTVMVAWLFAGAWLVGASLG
ncbi:MAG: hypothetical protein WKF75_12790 [Singulisphaera sp.]